ncbi:hypothetical protein [Vulcanisaeta thermophila]|uniref:hypothetical protein n=1 Tax=Vulcanisaeta thermophila TaxID=867917 RepID=UPI000853C889|nr:hypothetical protein [Vulcanisaeta thermophila]
MLQGLTCPRCGSRNIAIVASGSLTYKCLNCGHTWTPTVQGLGYVSTKAGEIHWTELKKLAEEAQVNAHKALNEGVRDCDALIKRLQEQYGSYLDTREIIKIALLSVKRYMEEVRYRDPQLFNELVRELERCRKLYHGS